MTEKLHVPKKACSTCPYRKDTLPGIWAARHYEQLRVYDEIEGAGPQLPDCLAVFHCHQANVTGKPVVCRGWLSTHRESVAVRLACALRVLDPGDVPREPEDCYYASGSEAADAGLAGVKNPSPETRAICAKLVRRGVGRWEGEDEEGA